jgi:hypothetical protein
MNIKLSTSLLTLTIATSLVSINSTPAFAQTVNGSDNGNNIPAITNVVTAIQSITLTVTPQVQAAINNLVNNLSTTSPTILAAISGGPTAPLLAALIPPGAGINPGGTAALAAAEAVAAAQGMVVNGVVNPVQVNNAIAAFNAYVQALVAEVGGARALQIITNTPGSLRSVLAALVDAGQ